MKGFLSRRFAMAGGPLAPAFALLAFACAALAAEDVKVAISPQPVMAGSPARLLVIHNGEALPEVLKFPAVDGISWSRSQSSSQSQVNGVCSSETAYQFTVAKEGSYKIPPMQVKVGGVKTLTPAIEFKAVSPKFAVNDKAAASGSKELSLDDILFAKMEVLSSRSKFYVGEEIPVEIRVCHADGMRVQLSWPELEFGKDANVVFKDYQSVNPKNPKFDQPGEMLERINSRTYRVYSFRTAFRAISPGRLVPSAMIGATLWIPESNQRRTPSLFDDDFFFGDPFSRGRPVERTVSATSPPLEILPLPPAPAEASFLGLVGDWKIKISLSEGAARVGEPLSLKINLKGEGALDSLKAPNLEFPGFRVYPPEVDKARGNEAEIRYVLIPTEAGEAEVSVKVSAFDTAEGKYKEESLSKKVKIGKSLGLAQHTPGQVVLGSQQGAPGLPEGGDANGQASPKRPTEALYLKRNVSGSVDMPLWRNAVVPCAAMLAAGLLLWLSCELVHARKAAMAADPRLARRMAARRRKGSVLKRLKSAKPEEIADIAGAELLPYLNELLDSPPGSGASEIASKLGERDAELAGCLRGLADAAWTPGLKSRFDEAFKTRLVKAVSKFAAVAALASMLCAASQAKAAEAPSAPAPATPEEALTAYDSGNFAGAAKFYKSRLDPAKPSPQLLYNIGNCLYQSGDLPRALVCYERARRLSPRDSDILENLNLARRKLLLPERGRVESPLDLLASARDFLRPDEWMTLSCAGLLLALASLGFRRLLPGPVWKAGIAAGMALALAAGISIASQLQSSYSEKSALVVVRNAPVHSLPSAQSGKTDMKLKAGEELSIEERRQDWARVRSGDAEGWMSLQDIAPLWEPERAAAP